MSNFLNIISFDVPFPPNYGGAIDVFYKLKALHNQGIRIIFHTYEYGRGEQKELNKYCEHIIYYKRTKSLLNIFSKLPFIVKTRDNILLVENLKTNNYPILFEGIHTTFPILKFNFKNRILIIRSHNIEHHYYNGLSKSESNLFKKIFFKSEALKLKTFEKVLKKVNHILTISPLEQAYFLSKYDSKAIYLPAFQEFSKVNSKTGKGKFALYHGDLKVADNIKSCNYLIKIFSKINFPLIIASDFIPLSLKNIKDLKTIQFVQLKTNEHLKELIKEAHINVLPTFQNTGIKLKLINALFNGRFCLVNDKMILNTGLENLCSIANSKKEFITQINDLSKQEFRGEYTAERTKALQSFDTTTNAKKIINLLELN